MIIVKLWGGLGNQLFQYALGYVLSKERNAPLAFDIDFYKKQPGNVGNRKIELNNLNIYPYELYSRNGLLKILNNKYVGAITRRFNHFEIKLGNDLYYFKEPEHRFVEFFPDHKNLYLDGYWQSSDYFSKYRQDICNMFQAIGGYSNSINEMSNKLKYESSVAIHMRKGDFGNGYFRKVGHPINSEYYINSIRYIKDRIETPRFYVFSDDKEWAKSFLKDEINSCVFISDNLKTTALDDLYLMSSCRNGIMSASTFSWWGNWLRDEDGIVVAPLGEYYNERFFENKWIRM